MGVGLGVSVGLVPYSEMIRLIIASKGSSAAASALTSDCGPRVYFLAERVDLGWFVGSLALKRWIR